MSLTHLLLNKKPNPLGKCAPVGLGSLFSHVFKPLANSEIDSGVHFNVALRFSSHLNTPLNFINNTTNIKCVYNVLQDNTLCLERKMAAGIYRITNSVNGKVYIGMSTNIDQRRYDHFKDTAPKYKSKLQAAFKKYGKDSFIFEPVYVCISQDYSDLHLLEAEFIKFYDSVNSGYNILPASKGFGSYGKEWAEKCKERAKNPELRKKFASHGEKNPMFGRSRKGERVGGAVTPMYGEKNGCWKKNPLEGKSAEFIDEFKKKSARPGKLNGCYGSKFVWINKDGIHKRHDEKNPIPDGWNLGFCKTVAMQNARKRKVKCIDTEIEYESTTEAGRQTGCLPSKITLCCQGKRIQTNKLRWEYV
jgi:group I intron endonuclease